jgi:hypothetical protein
MFGVQNDANNFGYSAGLLANTIANRPIRAALGTLFVSTDTLLLYRWTGSVWVEISGGGGTVTGAFNGCQEQANEIGLGGVLSEATQIETDDFPISFTSGATSTAQFQVISEAPISELAYFSSINAANDGGVYIGNFETFGTIQSKEYAGQTATELRINYDGGNIQLGSGNLGMTINDDNNSIYTQYSSSNIGLNLDFVNTVFYFGDFDNVNNGTLFRVSDNDKTISAYINGSDNGLRLNFDNYQFDFGDYQGLGNTTFISVIDGSFTIEFVSASGFYNFANVPNHAGNAAAILAGLNVGDIYRVTGTGNMHIVF